jgi:hypothetical protein
MRYYRISRKMVKKLVYILENGNVHRNTKEPCTDEKKFVLGINSDVHKLLTKYKSCIDYHFKTGDWERCKKRTNDYELVFTSMDIYPSVCSYYPISRSFFKMWEIMCDFPNYFDRDAKNTCVFLAEGPGGFIEAYAKWRGERFKNDVIHTTTLLNANRRTVPMFKIPESIKHRCEKFNVTYGQDNTGNICNIQNIKYIIQELGENSCDLVTADGGFDFSSDFNSQEQLSSKLIKSEVLMALRLQKPGGVFILKMYDISMYQTFQLVMILQRNYREINIVKPLTSRPANSEKYIVCGGFLGGENAKADAMALERSYYGHFELEFKVPLSTLYDILEFNIFFILKQILYIVKTVQYIKHGRRQRDSKATHQQLQKAIRWCHKYKIPISSLKPYCDDFILKSGCLP